MVEESVKEHLMIEKEQEKFLKNNREFRQKVGRPNVIFVIGGPGSGKTTQCKLIKINYKYPHISTGDLMRQEIQKDTPLGRTLKQFKEKGELVPCPIVLNLVQQAMIDNPSETYLIDGFPRTVEQALIFETFLGEVVRVIHYDLPHKTMMQRCNDRGVSS